MRKVILMVLIYSLTMSNSAISAKNDDDIYIVYGIAELSCGEYLRDRQKDNNSYTGGTAHQAHSFFYGFLTGYNLAPASSQSTLVVRGESVVAYLDNFCRTKPLKNLLDGYGCLIQSNGMKLGMKFNCE